MTYIDYINQFWKMNRSVEFSPNEVFLYFYLLNECNIRGWQNPFEHPNKTIVLATGISEPTVIEVRNRLQQKGLISFESGKKNAKSPVYYLNDLSKPLSKVLSKTLSKPLSKSLSSYNKTKDNKTITPSHVRVGELFPEDSFFDKSLADCYTELKSNQSWAETVTMNTRSSGNPDFTLEDFHECLKLFFMEQQNKGETSKSPKDAMSHFASWLKIELKNKKDERRTNKSRDAGGAKPVADSPGDSSNPKGVNPDAASLTSWIDGLSIGR